MNSKYICDSTGAPLVIFHGTPRDFVAFNDEFNNSVGFHFGCREQAEYRVRHLRPSRIISVRLLKGRGMLEINDGSDPGWENPALTVIALMHRRIIGITEAIQFGYPTSFVEARDMQFSDNERKNGNRRIADYLRSQDYDSIAYSNRNEPKDGKARDAFCVLDSSQIEIIDIEQLS